MLFSFSESEPDEEEDEEFIPYKKILRSPGNHVSLNFVNQYSKSRLYKISSSLFVLNFSLKLLFAMKHCYFYFYATNLYRFSNIVSYHFSADTNNIENESDEARVSDSTSSSEEEETSRVSC